MGGVQDYLSSQVYEDSLKLRHSSHSQWIKNLPCFVSSLSNTEMRQAQLAKKPHSYSLFTLYSLFILHPLS